jgi:L-histidine Nalpha-methyltransferase
VVRAAAIAPEPIASTGRGEAARAEREPGGQDTGRLLRAYNDSAGVTAEFNRNVLKVINRELRADFDVEEFEHVAIWDAEREWIEMRLRSVGAQVVTVGDLGLTVSFAAGEEMRTEVSAKFRPAGIRAELAGTGFRTLKFWTDPDCDFGLTLAERPSGIRRPSSKSAGR